MSLIGALNAGASGLAASQASIQTTGNNISNSGNADYVREVANQSPSDDQQISQGIFVGTGVTLTSVQRQVDEALDSRLVQQHQRQSGRNDIPAVARSGSVRLQCSGHQQFANLDVELL